LTAFTAAASTSELQIAASFLRSDITAPRELSFCLSLSPRWRDKPGHSHLRY
jgi:hypothetical protein